VPRYDCAARFARDLSGTRVRFVVNVCLLLACFGPVARGADITPAEEQIVSLAVDFCGGLVGENPGAGVAASQKIAGLKLSAAKPLKEWTADERARSGIRAGLAKELDDPLRFAAFADAPDLNSKPGAMFAVDESACSASGTAKNDVFDAIGTRMTADARWKLTEQNDNPRTATWRRTTLGGAEVVFMLFNVEMMTFNRVVAKSPPTMPDTIRPIVKSVADTCVNGVLNGSDLDGGNFGSQFYVYRHADTEGHAAQMRTFAALPRAMLNASSFKHEFYCEFSLGTSEATAEPLRAVMTGIVGGFNGVSATSDHEWRIRQKGKSHQANVSIEVDPRGLILLVIKTQGGHF
jgi:hypothetical protein